MFIDTPYCKRSPLHTHAVPYRATLAVGGTRAWPVPAAATWPSVVSGAPGGAVRESPSVNPSILHRCVRGHSISVTVGSLYDGGYVCIQMYHGARLGVVCVRLASCLTTRVWLAGGRV